MPAIIETDKLARSFGPNRVVDGLDLRVEAGEIFGLLGPNGAGKTTTIRMLTTLLAPTSGTARVCGFDIGREAREVRKRVGYVMQEVPMALYALTARERVEMEASLYHVPKASVSARATAVLDVVGLLGDADRRFRTFSGGMQKRLDLACGMLHEPQLLVLDEPTLGLDVQSRHHMWDYVRGLQGRGVSVLLATNYLDEADRLCDRLTIIDNGKMVVTGVPADLKRTVGADVVQVSSQSEQALLSALEPQPWVLRSAGNGAGEVTVHVTDGASAIPAIMRVATDAGLTLDRVTYSQPTLDDVFLLHTGHELRPTE
ncbi:MAG: ATP-binding cassette domain-containing protein [Anaerolineaceae bacterium]